MPYWGQWRTVSDRKAVGQWGVASQKGETSVTHDRVRWGPCWRRSCCLRRERRSASGAVGGGEGGDSLHEVRRHVSREVMHLRISRIGMPEPAHEIRRVGDCTEEAGGSAFPPSTLQALQKKGRDSPPIFSSAPALGS